MHTTKFGLTTFNHNGDYSGDVLITVNADQTDKARTISVPFRDLKRFVAEWVRESRIKILEEVTADRLLQGHL